jgi:tetratricopeptide (TPR) repeat protein
MKKISIIFKYAAVFGFLLLGGCADELDSIRPRDQIAQDQLSETDLNKVINGVYAIMENFVKDYYFDGDVKGENFKAGPAFSLVDPVMMTPSSGDVLSLWRRCFTALQQVNFLVEIYEESANKENATTKIAGGTGYYFRALIYYNMAIRWGGAPILRQRTKEIVPISPEAVVWNFILEDLGKAEPLLSEFSNRYYLSKNICHALFAKTYLSIGNDAKAIEYADKVIAKPEFALAANSTEYASSFVFGTQSKEIVFALANARTSNTLLLYDAVNDIDGSWNYSPATDCFSNLYADKPEKTGDIRAQAVFGSNDMQVIKFPNGQQTGQFVVNSAPTRSPLVVTRIAEMHLIKAEAQKNTPQGRQTLTDFMETRYTTVNLPQTLTDREFQDIILDERHREFYGEGFRWYDLKRTNRLDLFETLNGRNYLMYFPVPQNEIDLAGELNYPQNPEY